MITLTQLAGSTEPMQFSIAAIDAQGDSYNPSSDAVAVAFAPVTSPPTPFNAATATWNTASWAVASGPVYWVTILVGPANGGVTLTAGSYVAYVKITDSPAVPVEPAAYVVIT